MLQTPLEGREKGYYDDHIVLWVIWIIWIIVRLTSTGRKQLMGNFSYFLFWRSPLKDAKVQTISGWTASIDIHWTLSVELTNRFGETKGRLHFSGWSGWKYAVCSYYRNCAHRGDTQRLPGGFLLTLSFEVESFERFAGETEGEMHLESSSRESLARLIRPVYHGPCGMDFDFL